MASIHGKWSGDSVTGAGDDGCEGFMLFGVRVVTEGSFRKSASMHNLVQYNDHQPQDASNDVVAAGYASDDVVHPSGRSRERKRGVPWSEEEHRMFLLGLQRVGKGDWRGISRNYVKTRTPTQVASHAQKYFIRRSNHNRRRRRSSLFDITTDAVVGSSIEDQMPREKSPQPPTVPSPQNLPKNPDQKNPMPSFPVAVTPLAVPIPTESPVENISFGQVNQLNNSPKPIRPIPILPIPPSYKLANLKLDKNATPSLSLDLSISLQSLPPPPPPQTSLPSNEEQPPSNQQSPSPQRTSAFRAMPGTLNGNGGDSIISVA